MTGPDPHHAAAPPVAALGAVVFDLDGVLIDSEHLWEEMWTRYAKRHGVRWTTADTSTVQGMSASEWSAYLADTSGSGESPEQVERAVVDDMLEALEGGRMELFEGAEAMVREVSQTVPTGLATSATRRLIAAVLERHGLAACFVATVSSAEVPRGKPHPDVYLEAARQLGVAAPGCIGVEDSGNGIRAAHAAGMTVVAIPNPSYPPEPDALKLAARIASGVGDAHREVLALLPGAPDEPRTNGAAL